MTEKAAPKTLYVRRNVTNAAEIIKWAKGQGFKTTLPAAEMHVTITYSRAPVDWLKMGDPIVYGPADDDGSLHIPPGPARVVEPLGDKGAVVLMFTSSALSWRHEDMIQNGASWDYPGYQPHISITYDGTGMDLSKVKAYTGKIILGPEIFEEVQENWMDTITEKNFRVAKIDEGLGLVYGFAIVCKVDGEPYYDLNIDKSTGTRVPEHIPEDVMAKSAADFMMTTRPGNEMHKGADKGHFVFAFPLTTDIAKALGIQTRKTGLLVAYKPPPAVLEKFRDGTYTGFSIEGECLDSREHSDG